MAGRKTRTTLATFNLSFLDIMFCGFGAVVLLVLLVNSLMIQARKEKHQDIRQRAEFLQQEVDAQEKILSDLKTRYKNLLKEREAAGIKLSRIEAAIESYNTRIEQLLKGSASDTARITALKRELKAMEKRRDQLAKEVKKAEASGQKPLQFAGRGNRQYLTGLKLGGRRVVILLDTSASMLDRTIVGIIKKRNMPSRVQRQSWKWRQAKETTRWLLANLPLSSRVRVYGFGPDCRPLGDSGREWIPVSDNGKIRRIADQFNSQVPKGGTSLYRAFATISQISPRPDNIILITDGLPTLGKTIKKRGSVTASDRAKLFRNAVKMVPSKVPVNTILLPLEGDPMAAALYWELAVKTHGSFFTPSRDWP